MARAIDDAGVKIGGARKDFRERRMTEHDLGQMTAHEQATLVTKEAVWPQPDWSAMASAGADPTALAMCKAIRDRLAAQPSDKRPEYILGYIRGLDSVRRRVEAVRTVDDVRALTELCYRQDLGYGRDLRDPFPRIALAAMRVGNKDPLYVDRVVLKKARDLVAKGWPSENKPWMVGYLVEEGPQGAVVKDQYGRRMHETGSRAEAEAFLKDRYETARASKAARKASAEGPVETSAPERPHLDRIQRDGLPDVRQGRDISPEEFIAAFGFRAVEFGNWLPDDERQRVLNLGYEALCDLAWAMGIPREAVGFGGRLAAAFGARGKGSFAAHYEPGRAVINLTRLSGAGALAHEYAHAFDHAVGEMLTSDDAVGTRVLRHASGFRTWLKHPDQAMVRATQEERSAWVSLMSGFLKIPRTADEYLEHARSEIETRSAKCRHYEQSLEAHLRKGEAGGRVDGKWVREVRDWISRQEKAIEGFRGEIAWIEAGNECWRPGARTTWFMEQAQRLNGKSGEYWTRPCEMLARSFECWVFDRLAQAGARSDYLVHGVEGDRFADQERYKGNPYPSGRERPYFASLVQQVVDSMRPRLAVERDEVPLPSFR
jgi:hypothetical protein